MSIELYQGDCLDIIPKLISSGIRVDAVIADPPYEVLNNKCFWDNIIDIDKMFYYLDSIKRGADTPIVLFSQEPYTSKLVLGNLNEFRYKWFWEKTQATGFLNAKKQPMRCIEEICVFYEKQCLYNAQKTYGHKPVNNYTKRLDVVNKSEVYGTQTKELSGGGNTDRYPRQLLTFKSDKQLNYLHPTQKPLELLKYLVKTYTNEGDTVLDFCMGSGTTGVACKILNRNFIGIELEKKYFDIARKRIEKPQERDLF